MLGVGGGLGPRTPVGVSGQPFGYLAVQQGIGLWQPTGSQIDTDPTQFRRRLVVGSGDPGDDGEFADVGLEVAVELLVAGRPEFGLIRSELAHHVDGGGGGLGVGEQIEPPRDEDVSDENVEVGRVAVAGGPGVLVGEPAGQREPLVDKLDAGGAVVVAVGRVTAGRRGGNERQHARRERSVIEPGSDTITESVRLDIVDTRQCGLADRRHFLHWRKIAVARPKTFGNTSVSRDMVQTTVEGDVRVVTLARPARRNALDSTALRELEQAVTDAIEPVLYLHGEGAAFCAGADLEEVCSLDGDAAADFAALGQRVANTLEEYDGAVVAGIDGAARGGGVELALACDLRVATPEASFAETGVKLGLFGAWGGTTRLPRVVGEGDAMDLALSGRTVDAETALRMGLVSRITERPRDVANELAAVDGSALRTLKRRLRDGTDQETGDERERAAFASLATDSGEE